MQITSTNAVNNNIFPIVKDSFAINETSGDFSKILMERETKLKTESLLEQRKEILALGESIIKKIDIEKIKDYQEKIKKFLKDLSNQTYSFNEDEYTDNKGRSKYISTIDVKNKELEAIFENTKIDQVRQMNILSRIQEIHGLILNITVWNI